MKTFFSCIIALFLLGVSCTPEPQLSSVPSQTTEAWDSSHTWVFAVGVLEWQDSESFGSFPKEGRQDVELVHLFADRGVPQDHITFFMDTDATKARIESAFVDMIKKIPATDTLIVYYAGHGAKDSNGETYFAPYDTGQSLYYTAWSVSWIHQTIEKQFHGRQVILTADACYSGSLGEGTGFHTKKSYASLASSLSSQPSTANWTFTKSLIAGFNGDGAVDINRDGNITFSEIAHYTSEEMAFVDGQRSSFVTHEFNPEMEIGGSIGSNRGEHYEQAEVEWKGDWYKAEINDRRADKSYVHYVGYGNSYDEWVGLKRIRPYAPPQFAVGTHVEVAWSPTVIFDQNRSRWYPARVLKAEDGLHLIHYDGYLDSWDEWVSPNRIRPMN